MPLRFLSNLLSVLFHPLFILLYALLMLWLVNPYLFGGFGGKNLHLAVIYIFILTCFLPIISILLMRGLGFIDSFQLKDSQERIAPYIATGIFYVWTFLNVKGLSGMPIAYKIFVLGATISLFIAFFINLFSKISMHTVGMGGFVGMTLLTTLFFSYGNISSLLLLSIVLAGAVGTARLHLKAHETQDIFGGYLVGFIGQFIAYQYFL